MISIKKNLATIRFFVREDFFIALQAFEKASERNNNLAGCYSLLRILFPLIDHMGQLGKGKSGDHSLALKNYIKIYLGKINPLYSDCSGLIVKMYRHGLLHQLQPNKIKHRNSIIEWKIGYREKGHHLVCEKEGFRKRRLHFDIEQFAKDFLKSITVFEDVLRKDKNLKQNCLKTLKEMNRPFNTRDLSSGKTHWLDLNDFKILNQ